MARFQEDPNRVNYQVSQTGAEYNLRLLQRSQVIFTNLLDLLASTYVSTIQGPNYTTEMKAVAVELARLELALEDVDRDRAVSTTRPDFLYSIIGYMLFLNGTIPNIQWSDEKFRDVLVNLLKIYYQGSLPKSMAEVASLFLDGTIQVFENYVLIRKGATGLDISDQFGFQVDVLIPINGQFPPDVMANQKAVMQVLDIIRPAHTLYRLRYVFQDQYLPNAPLNQVLDSLRWVLSDYFYDDFRRYCDGIFDRDRLGVKRNRLIVQEDHSDDF